MKANQILMKEKVLSSSEFLYKDYSYKDYSKHQESSFRGSSTIKGLPISNSTTTPMSIDDDNDDGDLEASLESIWKKKKVKKTSLKSTYTCPMALNEASVMILIFWNGGRLIRKNFQFYLN